jgi:hypothetical protein
MVKRIHRSKADVFVCARILSYKQKGSNALSFLRAKLRRRAILTPYADAFLHFKSEVMTQRIMISGKLTALLTPAWRFYLTLNCSFGKFRQAEITFSYFPLCVRTLIIVAAC